MAKKKGGGNKKDTGSAKARKNRASVKTHTLYEGGKAKKKTCPKCGPGYFMAEHKNRFACGKCGYTEFKK